MREPAAEQQDCDLLNTFVERKFEYPVTDLLPSVTSPWSRHCMSTRPGTSPPFPARGGWCYPLCGCSSIPDGSCFWKRFNSNTLMFPKQFRHCSFWGSTNELYGLPWFQSWIKWAKIRTWKINHDVPLRASDGQTIILYHYHSCWAWTDNSQ